MAQDIFASRKGEGIAHGDTGTFTGDGTVVTIHLGYTPKHFVVVNITDVIRFEKIYGMTAANVLKQVAGGTMTVDTGSLVVISTDAKTVTLATGLALSAKSFVWFAA